MKIDEITVGAEYAAYDGKRRTHYGSLPRHCKVQAVEAVEERVWNHGGFGASRSTRSVRRVRVEMLDEPSESKRDWIPHTTFTVPKGETLLLPAAHLIDWKTVRKDVVARIRERDVKADTEAAYEQRVRDLLPRRMRDDLFYADVGVHGRKVYTDMRLSGRVLDEVLRLAELGKSHEDLP